MKKIIDYFGGEKRFYIILAVLFIMWLGVMAFFWIQAENVSKTPCSVCAAKLQEKVICKIGSQGQIIQRIFYPNFTIADSIRK